MDDLVADHFIPRAADELRDDILPERANKNDDRRGGGALTHARQKDAVKGLPATGSEIARGIDQGEVEFFRSGIDGQDRKGELGVDHHHKHGPGIVEQQSVLTDEVQPHEEMFDRSLGMQQGFPGEDADQEVGEKRQHHEQQQRTASARCQACQAPAHGQGEREAGGRGRRADPERAPQHRQINRIGERLHGVPRPAVSHTTAQITQAEGQRECQQAGQGKEHDQPSHGRGGEQEFLAIGFRHDP